MVHTATGLKYGDRVWHLDGSNVCNTYSKITIYNIHTIFLRCLWLLYDVEYLLILMGIFTQSCVLFFQFHFCYNLIVPTASYISVHFLFIYFSFVSMPSKQFSIQLQQVLTGAILLVWYGKTYSLVRMKFINSNNRICKEELGWMSIIFCSKI